MKIVIFQIDEQWQKEFCFTYLADHELVVIPDELHSDNSKDFADAEVISVFIRSNVDKEVLDNMPNLRFITTRSTGFDHVDVESARKKRIPVSNVPFYGENTVAEHTMALVLSLARNLRPSFQRVKEGKFDYDGLRGWDLKGKRIGIVGGGHIGMHVAKMAKGFEMDVVVYDLNPNAELADSIGFKYVDTDELLKTSNVISLHLPLNEHTQHFLNDERFSIMRDGVYIVNTARGGLIDTEALIYNLRSGKVAGAGLDVLEEEDLLKEELHLLGNPEYKSKMQTLLGDHILMGMDNVIVTPHNAFNSLEAVERILQTTIENIHSFISGNPQNIVNK